MAKLKDIEFQPSKELETELNESEKMKNRPVGTKLHQDVNLAKGEHQKSQRSRKNVK